MGAATVTIPGQAFCAKPPQTIARWPHRLSCGPVDGAGHVMGLDELMASPGPGRVFAAINSHRQER